MLQANPTRVASYLVLDDAPKEFVEKKLNVLFLDSHVGISDLYAHAALAVAGHHAPNSRVGGARVCVHAFQATDSVASEPCEREIGPPRCFVAWNHACRGPI